MASKRATYSDYKTLRAQSHDFADMDSILSIVQSYYVDQGRSGPHPLMLNAVKELARQLPSCDFVNSGAALRLKVGNESIEIPSDNASYHSIIRTLVKVAAALDLAGEKEGEPSSDRIGMLQVANAMLGALDAHSALLSKDAYKELRQGTEGAFGGLGVLVGIRDKVLTVIKPLPESPASRAGIQKLDKILKINDVSTFGFGLDDLVEFMRGDPGTAVNISVLRQGAHAPRDLILNREIISVNSVESRRITTSHGILLHLVVENFAARTAQEVWSAIQTVREQSRDNLSGVILDLRSNPGGLLDQAVQLADLFLDKGTIVSTKGRRIEVESADDGYAETEFPIMVLINNDTASASEIVAGALQDHNRAIVIGQPSFGKGSVQTIFELPGEQALKLTVARYYTPSERSIQNVGIFPDIWLQPVFKEKTNKNLLGAARYRGEQYLLNHLNRSLEDQAQVYLQSTALMGYALMDHVDEAGFEQSEKDESLDLAVKIIDEVKKRYPQELPEPVQRASHWMVMASKTISQRLKTQGQQVESWLRERFGVDWREYPSAQPKKLNLSLQAKGNLRSDMGSQVFVPYKIENPHSSAMGRVSLFVRSQNPMFDSQEVLLGSIPAGSTLSGNFDISVPSFGNLNAIDLKFGYAIDSIPSKAEPVSITLQINEPAQANIFAEVSLVEEQGGMINGVLESSEIARMRLVLQNNGPVDLHGVRISLFNLSGQQVHVKQQEYDIESIKVGGSEVLELPIAASSNLQKDQLDFGVSVTCSEVAQPINQSIFIKSSPKVASNHVSRTGH